MKKPATQLPFKIAYDETHILENAKKMFLWASSYFSRRQTFFAARQLTIFLVTFILLGDVIGWSKISDAAYSCCCIVGQVRGACDSNSEGFCHEFQCFYVLPEKNQIFVCKPHLNIPIFFLSLYLCSKALRFFLMPVGVLGVKF